MDRIDTSRYQHSPFASVYLELDQTPTKVIFDKIRYDSFDVNENGCFDFTNSRYNATKAGRLQINSTYCFSVINTFRLVYAFEVRRFNKSGVFVASKRNAQRRTEFLAGDDFVASSSIVFAADVGDYFDLVLFTDGDVTLRGNSTLPNKSNSVQFFYLP
jgi:hypothetical protein